MSFVMKTANFSAALKVYKAATKKDMSAVINRAMGNVGYRAAQFTPKKDPAQIEEELRKDKIALKFITKKLTAKIGTSYATAKGKMRTIKRVTRKQIALRTRQFIARRKKRRGFLRAGWVAALIRGGFKASGLNGNLIADSKSSLGRGTKATPSRLVASLSNAVYGRMNGKSAAKIKNVMLRALNKAMNFVAADMTKHAREVMGKTAARLSARKR